MTDESKSDKSSSEKEKLVKEKISLAKKIRIWGTFDPVENYETTDEYKQIKEIDKRLAEIG